MFKVFARHEPKFYSVMRAVVGFLFFWHGCQKLLGFPPSGHDAAGYVRFGAGPIELFGGALIMVGLATRPVAFLASGLMAFAYWMAHGTNAVLPIVNKGELAVLYCFVFLAMSARGAGPWSIDALLKKGKPEQLEPNA